MKTKKLIYQRAFTMIELLVVISIIAILSSIIMSSLAGARVKAQNTERNGVAMQYRNALELYASSHNGKYPFPYGSSVFSDDQNTGFCLGDYPEGLRLNESNPCGTGDSMYPIDVESQDVAKFKSELSPEIPGFPRISSTPFKVGNAPSLSNWLGGIYRCVVIGSEDLPTEATLCPHAEIVWKLEGKTQKCPGGATVGIESTSGTNPAYRCTFPLGS